MRSTPSTSAAIGGRTSAHASNIDTPAPSAAGDNGHADAHEQSIEGEEQGAADGKPTTTNGRGKCEFQNAGLHSSFTFLATSPIEAP
ncbi:MAG: hypothetical protein MEQ07_11400 [Aquimonas sp.]|nr:hypothetical protein [Aquimonas sp.]